MFVYSLPFKLVYVNHQRTHLHESVVLKKPVLKHHWIQWKSLLCGSLITYFINYSLFRAHHKGLNFSECLNILMHRYHFIQKPRALNVKEFFADTFGDMTVSHPFCHMVQLQGKSISRRWEPWEPIGLLYRIYSSALHAVMEGLLFLYCLFWNGHSTAHICLFYVFSSLVNICLCFKLTLEKNVIKYNMELLTLNLHVPDQCERAPSRAFARVLLVSSPKPSFYWLCSCVTV